MQNLKFMQTPLSPVSIYVFTLKYIHGRGAGVRAQRISRELLEKREEVSHSEDAAIMQRGVRAVPCET